ncbi:MAG TPA: cation diffusion facilitator family transporter [Candidatus Angelobacter sp.]|nr:cation diffusion facilitator family transporter [Candidatus Angelobacter sp.]
MEQVQAGTAFRPTGKATAALFSVLVNLVLIAGKLAVGLLTGSVAILADAAHSFLDLSASIFAFAGIRAAAKPADEDHAWGHAKAENISSLIQMFLLGATCIAIVIESVRRLLIAPSVRVAWYSFGVVLAAIIIDIMVSRYLQGVSRAHGGSAALEADALHFASDLWASVAVLIGLTLVAVFGLQIADPLAGIAVAIIIGTTAIEQGRRTTQVLLDAMPDRDTLAAIERILESDPRLHGYHALRARQAGKHVMLDVSVHVDGALSLAQAHEVGHAVSERIRKELPIVTDAVVHVEPVDDAAHG